MKARAIQEFWIGDRKVMPGESLDALAADAVERYIAEGLAARLQDAEMTSKPKGRSRKTNEVIDGWK